MKGGVSFAALFAAIGIGVQRLASKLTVGRAAKLLLFRPGA